MVSPLMPLLTAIYKKQTSFSLGGVVLIAHVVQEVVFASLSITTKQPVQVGKGGREKREINRPSDLFFPLRTTHAYNIS